MRFRKGLSEKVSNIIDGNVPIIVEQILNDKFIGWVLFSDVIKKSDCVILHVSRYSKNIYGTLSVEIDQKASGPSGYESDIIEELSFIAHEKICYMALIRSDRITKLEVVDEDPPKIRWYKKGKLLESFEEFISENALLRNTTFIPFEIRVQIDSELEISEVEDYKNLKLTQNNSYLRIINNKVIGKNVTFYSFNYLKNRTSNVPNNWNITRVRFNNNGLLVFDGKSKFGGESACVDERLEVIVNESKLYK